MRKKVAIGSPFFVTCLEKSPDFVFFTLIVSVYD